MTISERLKSTIEELERCNDRTQAIIPRADLGSVITLLREVDELISKAKLGREDLEQALLRAAIDAANRGDVSGAARLTNVYKRLSRQQGYAP